MNLQCVDCHQNDSDTSPHLTALVVNIEVPGGPIVLEGELQPVRMSDLLRLEHGVEVLNGDDRFRTFGFLGSRRDVGEVSEKTRFHPECENKRRVLPGSHVLLVVIRQGEFPLCQHELPLQVLSVLFALLPQHPLMEAWVHSRRKNPRSHACDTLR